MLQYWIKPAAACMGLAALLAAAFTVQPLRADGSAVPGAESRAASAPGLPEWEEAAALGDPDALFNLAQAYWRGRGVPADIARAEALCARAVALGHRQAADTYGLILFEAGRREAAMPYLQEAAGRGDPRAQYLVGIAHFNGDFVEQDTLRAYALMTLAKAAGLPQAAAALAEMDLAVPPAQRRQAAGLVERLRAEAQAARAAEPAAVELAIATGSEVPPAPAAASDGKWRVQLGAFSVAGNADALWNRLAGRAELAGAERLTKTSGRLTLLQAGGFSTREEAAAACSALKRSGHDCLVTDR